MILGSDQFMALARQTWNRATYLGYLSQGGRKSGVRVKRDAFGVGNNILRGRRTKIFE
jgi:hypothetical protein